MMKIIKQQHSANSEPRKATREGLRQHNMALLLTEIFMHEAIARSALARRTRLSKATVTDLTQEMLRQGLIEEVPPVTRTPSVGKPSELLAISPGRFTLLVADLSGPTVICADLNLRAEIRHTVHVAYPDTSPEAVTRLIIDMLDQLRARATRPILGIGISVPGIVDTEAGHILFASNLGWRDVPFAEPIAAHFGLPVVIGNDANLAALGEFRFGAGQPARDLIAILESTGLGAGIILDGRLRHGATYGSGGFGHLPIADINDRCSCGCYGCLETLVSDWGISRHAQRIAQQYPNSRLNELLPMTTIPQVAAIANDGDEQARTLMDRVAHHIGLALAITINLISPQRIIIGGALAGLGENFFDKVRTSARAHALDVSGLGTTIVPGALGSDAILRGAGALLLERELSLWNAHQAL